ncbi:MAG: RHS repeat domain-containing protein [Gammaproteobacteria bacterium]
MSHGMRHFIATLFLACLSLSARGVEEVIYYHNDALGSPIIATDPAGRVVWRKSYAPYGQPIGPGAPNEPGYTGKFEEPDLGIQDFGARWYDPRIGRFLAVDPVGFDPQNPQSFNRYTYANNNPYGFVDPDGRQAITAFYPILVPGNIDHTVELTNQQTQGAMVGGLVGASLIAEPAIALPGANIINQLGRLGRVADDVADVAKGGGTVIGKLDDIAPGKLAPGENTLLKHMEGSFGSPRANWKRNSSVLRIEMRKGHPIRDASVDPSTADLIKNTGFLRAERNLLKNQGWTYDPKTTLWTAPSR